MAEIKIEKKRPIWPWIIVILVILAIIAYIVYENQESEDYTDDFKDDVTTEQIYESTDTESNTYDANGDYSSSTFNEFSAFEESIRDSTRIAIDSSYTKKAFSNLAKAVVKKAEENNMETSPALDDLRNYTTLNTNISSTANITDETKNFKTACDKVANVLGDIQTESYPALQSEIVELKQVANNIDASISMDKQQASINSFLQKCKELLSSMNN